MYTIVYDGVLQKLNDKDNKNEHHCTLVLINYLY